MHLLANIPNHKTKLCYKVDLSYSTMPAGLEKIDHRYLQPGKQKYAKMC